MPDYTIFEDAPLTEPPVRLKTGLLRSGSNQPLDLITTNITLDLYKHDGQKTLVKAIALDSKTRYVAAALQNNGDIYDLPSDATVTLYIIRPDGVGVEIAGTTYTYEGDGGSQVYGAYAELTQAALAVKGSAVGQFKITVGEQILRTKVFSISIGQALDDTNEWAGEYQGYNLDEFAEVINGVENMTVSSQTLPQGASATVTKTEDEDGIINLDFGLPLASGEVQVVTVTGSNPTITAEYNKRYVCGEVSTLTITPASQGCTDVLFTSGTTPTVLSLPNTVKMPSWFTVEASKTYEINILDGVYGSVMSWT